jgi:hypothetical protein
MARWTPRRVLALGAALLGAAGADGPFPEDAVVGDAAARPPVESTSGPPGPRTRWIVLVAACLLISGLVTIVYGGFLPVPDWLSFRIAIPVLGSPPAVLVVLGGVSIVAAVGVLGVRAWGRALGAVVTLAGLSYAAWRSIQGAAPGGGAAELAAALLAGAWLDGILAAVVLFGLARRWPARPDGTVSA